VRQRAEKLGQADASRWTVRPRMSSGSAPAATPTLLGTFYSIGESIVKLLFMAVSCQTGSLMSMSYMAVPLGCSADMCRVFRPSLLSPPVRH